MLGDQILHFLEFFYYLLSYFKNRWSNGFTVWLSHRWISDFQSDLINSKKIPNNVKFGLQGHFKMENTSNGLDRHFRLRKLKNKLVVFRPKYNRKHISHTLYIYIEWVYGTMHSTNRSILRFNIFVFKIISVDPNCSTWFSYEYVLV